MSMTLVLGASTNSARYSNIATKRLLDAGEEVCLVGAREGEIRGQRIQTDIANCQGPVDTVTLYLGPQRQATFIDPIIKQLQPRRIIFNPGTENDAFETAAKEAGIEVMRACTLVMLASSQYRA